MTFAEDLSSSGSATQPSNNALFGVIIAILAILAVVVIGFLFFVWRLRQSPSQTKSSQKVDQEIEQE